MRIADCGFRIADLLAKITLTALSGLLLGGCVTRSLTIKTNPAEAMVYVNDQLKGKTPVTYDFTWYGWHRVMIRKDGFKRVDDRKMLRAPFYLWIPVDLVMELLPFHIHDDRVWEYTLTPQTDQIPLPPALFTKPEPLSGYSAKPKPAEPIKPEPVVSGTPEPEVATPAAVEAPPSPPLETSAPTASEAAAPIQTDSMPIATPAQPEASVEVKAEVSSSVPSATAPETPPAKKEWIK